MFTFTFTFIFHEQRCKTPFSTNPCAGCGSAMKDTANITAGPFALQFSAAQTLSLLALAGPAGYDGFAFSRGGGLSSIGDAVLRVRPASWTLKTRRAPPSFEALRKYPLWSSWHTTANNVELIDPGGAAFAAANLTKSLRPDDPATPSGAPLPFALTRSWERGADNDSLVLRFTITNLASEAIEVGGFGAMLPFPWAAGSPAGDAASTFLDPAITGQHGYATVTRLTGTREVLMITPAPSDSDSDTLSASLRTSLEAWVESASTIGAPDMERASGADREGHAERRGIPPFRATTTRRVHPGAHYGDDTGGGLAGTAVWLAHSKAYSQAEWVEGGKPWLAPTSRVLAPAGTAGGGASMQVALAFSVAADVRSKGAALLAAGSAEVLGVPGYILGADMTTAHVLVRPPGTARLEAAEVDEPTLLIAGIIEPALADGWWRVPLAVVAPGRPRLTLRYSDGSTQTLAYRTLPAFDAQLVKYGDHVAAASFFTKPDPFQRSPSCMPWDREEKSHVLDDARNFVVGLSDEGGAGANVGFASKLAYATTAAELALLDRYIQETLWGPAPDGAGVPVSLQVRDGSDCL